MFKVTVFNPQRNATEEHMGIGKERLIEGLHNGGLIIYSGDRCPIVRYQETNPDGLWGYNEVGPVIENHRFLSGECNVESCF